MTEKKTALTVSVIGILVFGVFAFYVAALNTRANFEVLSSGYTNKQSTNNYVYSTGTTLSNDFSNTLGVSVEYKSGVAGYLKNFQIEQDPAILNNL